jgi:hypothetical protein
MSELLEEMDGSMYKVYANNSTGTSIRGFPLATQVTGHIMYEILPEVTPSTRRRIAEDMEHTILIRPFEDLQQLDISKGDFVFQQIQGDTITSYDDSNPFSVFNGLKLEDSNGVYHEKYRFLGVAMSEYKYSEGSLAHRGIDVQTGGVVNWINSSDRTVYPGERITWIPETLVLPPNAKKQRLSRYTASSVSKAMLIPVENPITMWEEWANTTTAAPIPHKINDFPGDYTFIATDKANSKSMVRCALHIMKEIMKESLAIPIGICRSPTASNSIGQMELL